MLLVIRYEPLPNRTAENRAIVRRLFLAWAPPPEIRMSGHFHFVSGGGFIIADTEDPTAIFRSLEPFKPYTQFKIEPVINVMDASLISADVEEWAESIL